MDMSLDVAIVIPVYREALYIEKTLRSLEKSVQFATQSCPTPTVVIIVNNPQTISDKFLRENQMLIRFLEDSKPLYSFDMHILDYTDPGLKFGVGQARKIGMEYAIAKILKDPKDRIVCLDADCLVNDIYVKNLYQEDITSFGFTLRFEHPTNQPAMIYYELFQRYLSLGLSKADSPFDFIAIGSAMGCSVEGYKKVGGMPAKSSTEDFHFLNKLRKLGKIQTLKDARVYPSDRSDSKTPVGTGIFLQGAKLGLEKSISKLVIPSPEDFIRLKKVLICLQDFYATDSLLSLFEEIQDLESFEYLRKHQIIDKIHQIKQGCREMPTYFKRIMEVMDGLETIRLLRTYRKTQGHTTTETFTNWAATLAEVDTKNPKEILQTYRSLCKRGKRFPLSGAK